jgi:xanthine dehydrogenase accessory factor
MNWKSTSFNGQIRDLRRHLRERHTQVICGQDLEVLKQVLSWLKDGETTWLCTIVGATGSSPRPVGSMLGLTRSHQVGSLSGGCVEDDLIEKLRVGELNKTALQRLHYGVSAEENERLGLPCGGRLEVLVEALGQQSTGWLDEAVDALSSRTSILRHLDLLSAACRITAGRQAKPVTIDTATMVQSLGPQMRMLLVGAGQLAQVLSQLAVAMDYEVIVTDTRREVLDQWAGPPVPLIEGLPDDVVATHITDDQSLVITLTHDPRIDDMALLEALESKAWYVGALGSLRTTSARHERLSQLGLKTGQLERLRAPVGLDIGSKTPWEIAIAIMAEITKERKTRTV